MTTRKEKTPEQRFNEALEALRNASGLNAHAQQVCLYLLNQLVTKIEAIEKKNKEEKKSPMFIKWTDVNSGVRKILSDQTIPLWARRAIARWLRHYGKLPVDSLEPFTWDVEEVEDIDEVKKARSRCQSKFDKSELPDVLTSKDRQPRGSTTKETKKTTDVIDTCLENLEKRINKTASQEELNLVKDLQKIAKDPARLNPPRGAIYLGIGRFATVDEATLQLILVQFADKITFHE